MAVLAGQRRCRCMPLAGRGRQGPVARDMCRFWASTEDRTHEGGLPSAGQTSLGASGGIRLWVLPQFAGRRIIRPRGRMPRWLSRRPRVLAVPSSLMERLPRRRGHFQALRGCQSGMGKRLYVGNLPYNADEAMLKDVFGQEGRTVASVHIVMDRETNRPRGFAFVEMTTDGDAQKALAALDGSDFHGRTLRVNEAEDRRGPPGSGPRPGGGFGGSRPSGPGGSGGPRPSSPRPSSPRPDGPRSDDAPRPSGPSNGGGGGAAGPGGGAGGGGGSAGGGGFSRPKPGWSDPPAAPKKYEKAKPQRRRNDEDEDYGGRRGGRRFDEDDDT